MDMMVAAADRLLLCKLEPRHHGLDTIDTFNRGIKSKDVRKQGKKKKSNKQHLGI